MATHGIGMINLDYLVTQCRGNEDAIMGAVYSISPRSFLIHFFLNYAILIIEVTLGVFFRQTLVNRHDGSILLLCSPYTHHPEERNHPDISR